MKKIKFIPLLVIVFIYVLISSIFNYSLYFLSSGDFKHQYYLITLYFTGELFSFLLFLLPQNKELIQIDKLGSITPDNYNSFSSKDDDNSSLTIDIDLQNNNTNENDQDSIHLEDQPFIGLRSTSYIVPGIFDFLSKILILCGIHFMKTDSLFRTCFLLLSCLTLSKYFLNIMFDTCTLFGFILIITSLLFTSLYYQFSKMVDGLYIAPNKLFGLLFCIIGEFFTSIQYVIQAKYFIVGEKLFFKNVAFEGLFGFILSIVLLFFAINLKCPFDKENKNNFCNGQNFESNLFKFFSDFKDSNLKWGLFFIISSIFMSLLSSLLIKYNGIMSKVSMDACRVCFWMLQLIIMQNENFDYVSCIIYFICTIIMLGGMIICSEMGENKVNTIKRKKLGQFYKVCIWI